MCFSSGGTSDAARRQAEAEKKRQKQIDQGMASIDSAFSGLDDSFWSKRAQSYLDYYQPQLNQQYDDANQKQLYSITRNGLNDSSAAAKAYADLDRAYGTQAQGLVSGANDYVTKAKQQAQDEKNALVNQLTATANPTQATNAALAQAKLSASTPSFSPLGDLLSSGLTIFGNNNALTGNYGGTGTTTPWQQSARGVTSLVKQ